jgi:hypothetical protein
LPTARKYSAFTVDEIPVERLFHEGRRVRLSEDALQLTVSGC